MIVKCPSPRRYSQKLRLLRMTKILAFIFFCQCFPGRFKTKLSNRKRFLISRESLLFFRNCFLISRRSFLSEWKHFLIFMKSFLFTRKYFLIFRKSLLAERCLNNPKRTRVPAVCPYFAVLRVLSGYFHNSHFPISEPVLSFTCKRWYNAF